MSSTSAHETTGEPDWIRLLSEARAGDDRALGELVDRLRAYLTLTARGEMGADLRSKLGASDVVQEAMLEACRDFTDFRGVSEGEFRGWLARLVRHTLLDTGRRYRQTAARNTARETSIDDERSAPEPAGVDPSASTVLRRREADELLMRALATLPERARKLVELRHQQELSFAEVGQQLDMTEAAARQAYGRALKMLRSALGSSE